VGDRGDVGPLRDDQVQDGVTEERPGRLERDRAHTRYLTALVAFDAPTTEGLDVHRQVHARRWGENGRPVRGGSPVGISPAGAGLVSVGGAGVGPVGARSVVARSRAL